MKQAPAARRRAETGARLFAAGLILGLLAVIGLAAWRGQQDIVIVHALLPEDGGWIPGQLFATAGEPLNLWLRSDDVMHGFAVGQSDWPAVDLKPGVAEEITLLFDRPGRYVYYCTRWCGPDHWRMRGVIEVAPAPGSDAPPPQAGEPPLYLALNLDIDAPHPAPVTPDAPPSPTRGAELFERLPAAYQSEDYYRQHSPAQSWLALRIEPSLADLSAADLWDAVAYMFVRQVQDAEREEAARLYAENCAACHGETGAGDGVFAENAAYLPGGSVVQDMPAGDHGMDEAQHTLSGPGDFTDPASMYGASPALLNGKIVRGGMGTGMPYWGPIFTPAQNWALTDYLWTFVFAEP